MDELKRVVAVCGSSRAGVPEEKSLTQRMLENFLEGMAPEYCRIFYPHLMNIAYCRGCYTCWFKTPGICAIEDDMTEIRAEMDQADLIVLASPVYVDGLSAQTKVVLDRIISMLDPLITLDGKGHCRHSLLQPRRQKAVLISCCGFSEVDNFDHISSHFKAICRNLYWQDAGEILLPASGLAFVPKKYDEKFSAIQKAGAELSKDGVISTKTTEFISREILNAAEYQDFLNPYFSRLRVRQGTRQGVRK
ncbi:MAG: flavodoxin family protein [Bacillota bacterium]